MKLRSAIVLLSLLSLFSLAFAPTARGVGASPPPPTPPASPPPAEPPPSTPPPSPPPSTPPPSTPPPAQPSSPPPSSTNKTTPPPAVAVDTSPPLITELVVSGLTDSSATISWKTNEASSTNVYFGTSLSYGQKQNKTETSTEHSVVLADLNSDTPYYFKVESADAAGNLASKEGTFTTTTRIKEATKSTQKAQVSTASQNLWPWIIGILIGLGLLTLLALFLRKRKRKNPEEKQKKASG